MCIYSDDRGNGKYDSRAALLRQLADIEGAVPGARRSVQQDVPATCAIVALQKVRRDIGAFEMALIEARLRSLVADARCPVERQRVSDLAPLITRLAGERSRRQGRVKWSSN